MKRASQRPESPHRKVSLGSDPTWYKDAIIYELRTRSYFDANDDGIGDLPGLTSKLDYLLDLGVNAVWLLPFYPSPGRDDGYDISNYTDVHPDVGTLADFEHFLKEAHARGIRVITELVLNHTSDHHPWFQRARRAAKGTPERDFYVWSDTPDRYRDARIIFRDFEPSNWSWDPVAGAYFWHRFYSHQPDLNFENPAVHAALLEVVDFWLAKGVDGLRLDAVPYLYEEEGTNCENLPKTHAFLKKLRAHVDATFRDRMLLAEANQWPEDAAAYFGKGDECHMNFHFPLMPRMFMAIHMEDRLPLVDIFAQTPEVDASCQWALFLRNHDELTLEMVTDEERDYMVRAYAHQEAMRINLGIRRRLAPLVDNARRKMELLHGLLLSLPGTPVLYYGDEIGMGDNVYLGDRNGVRTPMQWNMDRNAGFSRANPQRLILPVVIDPEYHYESLNVENQQQNPTSLLWWTKRLVALRKRYKAFGRGTMEFLSPKNPRILAYVRRYEDECVLVVANLSRFTQYAELDLSEFRDWTPIELFGKTRFPVIGTSPYLFTHGPHGFYWFALERPGKGEERLSMPRLPATLECSSVDALLFGDERGLLDDALRAFLDTRKWVAQRGRFVRLAELENAYWIGSSKELVLAFVRATYTDGLSELCVLPLAIVPDGDARWPATSAVAHLEMLGAGGSACVLVDALEEPGSARQYLDALAKSPRVLSDSGERVLAIQGSVPLTEHDLVPEPRRLGRERNDSVFSFGDRLVLKVFRHVEEGVSPELEVGRFLGARSSTLAPALLGSVELIEPRAAPMTVAVLESFVPNVGTAWEFTQQELGRYYDRVLARGSLGAPPEPPRQPPLALVDDEPPQVVTQMIGGYRDNLAQLGRRIAELHLVLASNDGDPAFAPEPYSTLDRRSKYQSLRTLGSKVLRLLRERLPTLPPIARTAAERLVVREDDIHRFFEPLLRSNVAGLRIRAHGNLHLGHVLYTGKDFVFTDFDGMHDLILAERRRKRSPLRDVASIVRSVHLASMKHLFDPARVRESDVPAARPWAEHWTSWVSAALLRGYLEAIGDGPLLPKDRAQVAVLFDAFVMERELYLLRAHLEEGATAVIAPLLGIERILG
jgi:maltose alpha-D-glucosyltransferase/alpha-amylase